jgi:hypothetical protein
VRNAHTSLDPAQMKAWTRNSRYVGHAFGFMDPKDRKTRDTQFAAFLANREKVLPWILEYSPIEHASSDDPPVFMSFTDPPDLGKNQKDPTHTANFGVGLKQRLDTLGVHCELVYPGSPSGSSPTMEAFLIKTLASSGRP